MIGIYKITNIENNKIYIGLSRNLLKRLYNHKYHLRRNTHQNDHLQKAWNKYGENSFKFEIVEVCEDNKLNEREIYWINYYGGYESDNLYNIRDGGDSQKHSEETIEKIRKSNLGNPSFWKGKHLPEEIRQKISTTNKGRKMSEESKKKMSVAKMGSLGYWGTHKMSEKHRENLSISHKGQISPNKGKKASEETRRKLSLSHLGNKQSEESKRKISEHLKGKIVSEETRKKLSEANKGQSRLWINKDGVNTTIKKELLDEYLDNGWKRGYYNIRIWITNNVETKFINEEEFSKYENLGWKKGRCKHEN